MIWVLPLPLWEIIGIIWRFVRPRPGCLGRERRWLMCADRAKTKQWKKKGIQLPLEYCCISDTLTIIIPVYLLVVLALQGVWVAMLYVLLAPLLVPGLTLLLPGLSLAQRVQIATSFWYQKGNWFLFTILSLWFCEKAGWLFWILYRVELDHPFLEWLARAARWLGMRELPRVGRGESATL